MEDSDIIKTMTQSVGGPMMGEVFLTLVASAQRETILWCRQTWSFRLSFC
ncbi:MAG TPA: hypothetical protein VGN04_03740 [Herbaspirillum sp.]|jgi:hypothetical protein